MRKEPDRICHAREELPQPPDYLNLGWFAVFVGGIVPAGVALSSHAERPGLPT
jgi:hypothetical protein